MVNQQVRGPERARKEGDHDGRSKVCGEEARRRLGGGYQSDEGRNPACTSQGLSALDFERPTHRIVHRSVSFPHTRKDVWSQRAGQMPLPGQQCQEILEDEDFEVFRSAS